MSSPAFIRTPPGLSNQAAFLGVDLVVFAEGGFTSLTLSDVELGLDNGETLDAAFWRGLFDSFSPNGKTVYVKSVGSKETVKAIAVLISTGTVTKAAAAMDRDLDSHRGSLITHSNVLYTRGYSWENDVWTEDICNGVIDSIILDPTARANARAEINEFFFELQRTYRACVRFDRSLATAGRNPIHREGLMDTVRPSPPNRTTFLRTDIAALLAFHKGANADLKIHPNADQVLDDLHGHTLAKAAMATLRSAFQRFGNFKLSNSLLSSMALVQFINYDASPSLQSYAGPIQAVSW